MSGNYFATLYIAGASYPLTKTFKSQHMAEKEAVKQLAGRKGTYTIFKYVETGEGKGYIPLSRISV